MKNQLNVCTLVIQQLVSKIKGMGSVLVKESIQECLDKRPCLITIMINVRTMYRHLVSILTPRVYRHIWTPCGASGISPQLNTHTTVETRPFPPRLGNGANAPPEFLTFADQVVILVPGLWRAAWWTLHITSVAAIWGAYVASRSSERWRRWVGEGEQHIVSVRFLCDAIEMPTKQLLQINPNSLSFTIIWTVLSASMETPSAESSHSDSPAKNFT